VKRSFLLSSISTRDNLEVIGRWAAVGDAFGVHLSGFSAWLYRRLSIAVQRAASEPHSGFTQWVIQDLTFNHGARLISWNAPPTLTSTKSWLPLFRNHRKPIKLRWNINGKNPCVK
jgi:hypothetical protein